MQDNNNRVDASSYASEPGRYILVDGHSAGAPSCTFGNVQEVVGYDIKDKVYVRYTKSVYKRLKQLLPVAPVLNADGTVENNH